MTTVHWMLFCIVILINYVVYFATGNHLIYDWRVICIIALISYGIAEAKKKRKELTAPA